MKNDQENSILPEYDGRDCPEWDGTDLAHPAWWRGCDAGVDSTIHVIHKILDNIEKGAETTGYFGSNKLDMLRDRLYQMFERR